MSGGSRRRSGSSRKEGEKRVEKWRRRRGREVVERE